MQCFDDVLCELVRTGTISKDTALGYATNHGNLQLALSEINENESDGSSPTSGSQEPKPYLV